MKGTKIMVFSLKDIIKSTLLFVTGLIIILFIIFMVIPKDKDDSPTVKYIPGDYTSQVYLNDSYANVVVTVSDTAILDITLVNLSDTQEVFYPLLKPTLNNIATQVIQSQSTEIETDFSSVETTKILLSALDDALNKAIIIK